MVVMTVTEYNNDSLKDQPGPSPVNEEAAAAPVVDGSTSRRPFVAATIDPSNLRNCSCTNIVQFRS